jgi:hypothetical protein
LLFTLYQIISLLVRFGKGTENGTKSPRHDRKSDAGGAGLKLVKEFLLYLWLSNVIDLKKTGVSSDFLHTAPTLKE